MAKYIELIWVKNLINKSCYLTIKINNEILFKNSNFIKLMESNSISNFIYIMLIGFIDNYIYFVVIIIKKILINIQSLNKYLFN